MKYLHIYICIHENLLDHVPHDYETWVSPSHFICTFCNPPTWLFLDMCMYYICSTLSLFIYTVPEDCYPLCQWRWSSRHCESVTWERSASQHMWQGKWCVDHIVLPEWLMCINILSPRMQDWLLSHNCLPHSHKMCMHVHTTLARKLHALGCIGVRYAHLVFTRKHVQLFTYRSKRTYLKVTIISGFWR